MKKVAKEIMMYLTIEQTADYLDLDISEITRFIYEKQIRYVTIDSEVLINKEQFNFFLKQREKYMKELEEFLQTPLPEDIDIKDED